MKNNFSVQAESENAARRNKITANLFAFFLTLHSLAEERETKNTYLIFFMVFYLPHKTNLSISSHPFLMFNICEERFWSSEFRVGKATWHNTIEKTLDDFWCSILAYYFYGRKGKK